MRGKGRAGHARPYADRAECIKLYEQGLSYREIMKRMNCGSDFVRRVRISFGLAPRVVRPGTGRPKLPLQKRQQIADLIRSGLLWRHIEKRHDVSFWTINEIRKEFGIPQRKRH